MAWSVPIWKIFGFPKVSLYLESWTIKHATAYFYRRWHTTELNIHKFKL